MKQFIPFSWIGPAIFLATTLLFGFLYPDYSHIKQFISELGADGAPNYLLMNWLGIVPFGFSICLFSIGGFRNYKSIMAKSAFTVLFIVGILFTTAGIFNCDAVCSFSDMSQKAIIHNISIFSAFIISILAQLLLGLLAFSKNPHPSYVYCITSAVLGTVLFYLILKAGIHSDFRGLFQRFFLANFMIWLVLIGRDVNSIFKFKGDEKGT